MEIDSELLDTIVRTASEEAIKAYIKASADAAKEHKDRRLHNTKLILKNYHALKTHSSSSISELADVVDEEVFSLLIAMLQKPDADELKIRSIKNSVVRTKIILEHIDTMLEAYQRHCEKCNLTAQMRKLNVVLDLYVRESGLTPTDIAEKYHIDLRTLYRHVDSVCEEQPVHSPLTPAAIASPWERMIMALSKASFRSATFRSLFLSFSRSWISLMKQSELMPLRGSRLDLRCFQKGSKQNHK